MKFHPLLGEPANQSQLSLVRIRTSTANPNVGMFGMTRTNPDLSPKFHAGIDWLATPGTPVFAAHGGKIKDAGFQKNFVGKRGNEGYGLRVYITDGNRETTVYAHLSGISLNDWTEPVVAGQLIGWVGRTGNVMDDISIPTHLHFGCQVQGRWVNPLQWLELTPQVV